MKFEILILFTCFYLGSTSKICPRYSCGELDAGKCAEKYDTSNYIEWLFSSCYKKDTYCPYKTATLDDDVECKQFEIESNHHYPGAKCKDINDCIKGTLTCTNNKCIWFNPGEDCQDSKQCPIGYACSKTTAKCVAQLTDGAEGCQIDEECINTHGCLNGKCTAYFSLEDGSELNNDSSKFSFCKSGQAVNNVCRTLKLKGGLISCNSNVPCTYVYTKKDGDKTSEVEIKYPENCDCGFNNEGNSYCKNGNGDVDFNSYIYLITESLKEDDCHTEERDNCSYIKENDNKQFQNLKNVEVDVLDSHLLINSDSCVVNVVYPYYFTKIQKEACPKYSCTISRDYCISINEGILDKNKSVKLSSCIAPQTCNYDINSLTDITEEAYTATCTKSKITAYPGELCYTDSDCIPVETSHDGINWTTSNKCLNSKCYGANENEFCKDSKSCSAGLYCNLIISRCQNQRKSNESCTISSDCENNYICSPDLKCVEYFHFDICTNIKYLEPSIQEYACNYKSQYHHKCSKEDYSVGSKVENGVVKCDIGKKCFYDVVYGKDPNSKAIIQKDCQCGFNSSGQGYCPIALGNIANAKILNDFKSQKQRSLNNKFHTYNRFKVEDTSREKIDSHFIGAVDCVKNVLEIESTKIIIFSGLMYLLAFLF